MSFSKKINYDGVVFDQKFTLLEIAFSNKAQIQGHN